MGKKRTGNGRKPTTPWKAGVQAIRRKHAEERQAKYNALPLSEKLKRAGAKERAKLLARNA